MAIHVSPYRKLKYELENIQRSLESYKYSGTGLTLWKGLHYAFENKDKRGIIYCLSELEKWYASEMSSLTNSHNTTHKFGFKVSDHKRIYTVIGQLLKEIEVEYSHPRPVKPLPPKEGLTENNVTPNPLIFLSHSSLDTKYGDALEKFIVGLGVNDNQLIYTSHENHKIPLGVNIYDYLQENIHKNSLMIMLFSDNYLDSVACLNEVGAAWGVKCDSIYCYVPKFNFENPKYNECAIDTKKMGILLNGDKKCREYISDLKDKIVDMFNIEVNEDKFNYLLETFMTEIMPNNSNNNFEHHTYYTFKNLKERKNAVELFEEMRRK